MKICIPIMAATFDESIREANNIKGRNFDMVEWRVDCIDDSLKKDRFINAWNEIREAVGKPIIITMRTRKHGGMREMSASEYNKVIRRIINTIKPQYIDIELTSCGSDAYVHMLTQMAKKRDIKVIISYHDMSFTEKAREIQMLLCRMKYIGADIPKAAFTANCEKDVEELIKGAKAANSQIGDLIAISMGELGRRTRTDGDVFGSVVNYVKPVGSRYNEEDFIGQIEIE